MLNVVAGYKLQAASHRGNEKGNEATRHKGNE
jgi:hypothetical protein